MKRLSVKQIIADLRKTSHRCRWAYLGRIDFHGRPLTLEQADEYDKMACFFSWHADAYAKGRLANPKGEPADA